MSRRVGNIAFMVFMAVVAMIFIGITTYTRGYVAIGGEYVLAVVLVVIGAVKGTEVE